MFTQCSVLVVITLSVHSWCLVAAQPTTTQPPQEATQHTQTSTNRPQGTTQQHKQTTQELSPKFKTEAETTLQPPETTLQPPETTLQPLETTLRPLETTQRPPELTKRLQETTQRPQETTPEPLEATQHAQAVSHRIPAVDYQPEKVTNQRQRANKPTQRPIQDAGKLIPNASLPFQRLIHSVNEKSHQVQNVAQPVHEKTRPVQEVTDPTQQSSQEVTKPTATTHQPQATHAGLPIKSDRIQGADEEDVVEISGSVDTVGVTVWLQGRQIYRVHNKTRELAGGTRRFHSGVHVLLLHQQRFTILQQELFLSWQPAAHRMLVQMLENIQDHRLILFLGAPEFITWLLEDATAVLDKLGALLGPMAAQGEAWVFLAHKGHPPFYETLITNRKDRNSDVSPCKFSFTVPRLGERECWWHQDEALAARVELCETYEGYGNLCHCQQPLHLHPSQAPAMEMQEVIPVAHVMAKRLPSVFRQVRQLWQCPGGGQTPLAFLVDGYNHQAHLLATILNITAVYHNNSAPLGTKARVNLHIKFSLETIFKLYPGADKAIILEDDLILAPDFISYFQQTSLVMQVDPTVMCVNAYNYNAFPHTASDPARIYRAQSYPYYGWMTSRHHARRMLDLWVPRDSNGDWDLYSRSFHVDDNHEVIIPEVPRTRHEGGAGVHVTGIEQENSFNHRPLNTATNVALTLRRTWSLAYAIDLMAIIIHATVVNITEHPCVQPPIPRYQRNTTYVIYIKHTRVEDEASAYQVLGLCLGFHYHNMYEHYKGTFSLKYFETPFILVACPSLFYCDKVDDSIIYQPSPEDFQYAKKHEWRHSNITAEYAWRIPPTTPLQEFNLYNTATITIRIF